MGSIEITRREFTSAWRAAHAVSVAPVRSNQHRLLLFYAVECGLKAAFMKKNRLEEMNGLCSFFSHNLNELIDRIGVGRNYYLPNDLQIPNLPVVGAAPKQRCAGCGDLNVIWRYGGREINHGDEFLESKLEKLHHWLNETMHKL